MTSSRTRGEAQRTPSGTLVRRHTDEMAFRSELTRMRVAEEVAAKTALFRVPAVSRVEERELRFEIEWIDSYRPLGELPVPELVAPDLMARLGEALGAIHDTNWAASPGSPAGLFHGDPDPFNVGLDAEGALVFLDWDPAPGIAGLQLTEQQLDAGLLYFYLACLLVRRRVPRRASEGCLQVLDDRYRTGRAPGIATVRGWGTEVGRALSRWHSVPGNSIWQRVYRWRIRRVALTRIDVPLQPVDS